MPLLGTTVTIDPSIEPGRDSGEPSEVHELALRTLALQAALREALDDVSPPPRRPVDLVRRLGLDKSLASKIVKLSDDEDPLRGLRDGPGVPGLRLLDRSLEERSLALDSRARLTLAIDGLEAALARIPEGRVGLDAAIAGAVTTGNERLQRDARQAIFKATVLLHGNRIESSYHVYAIMPSKTDQAFLDMVILNQRYCFRRLRPGGAAILMSLPVASTPSGPLENLAGQPVSTPGQALLPAFGSERTPPFREVTRGGASLLVLEAGVPGPAEELTLTTGVIARGHWTRFAPEPVPAGGHYSYVGVTTRRPIRLMVIDMLLPRGLGLGTPEATITLAGLPALEAPQAEEFDAIEQDTRVQPMGIGTSGLACRGVPQAKALAAEAIRATGLSEREFDAFRLLVEYPLPNTSTRLWSRLPERPRP